MAKRRYMTLLATKQPNSADARRHLRDQSISYYNPMLRDLPRGGVRRVRSVFEFYLFVEVDLRTRWQVLHSTRGVKQVFMSGIVPARVPDADIVYFRSREIDSGYFVPESEEPPVFLPEDLVRTERGMFADQVGRYVGIGQGRRATRRVIYEILGKSVEFAVSAYDLVAA